MIALLAGLSAVAAFEQSAHSKLKGLSVNRAVEPFERVEFTSLWGPSERCVTVFLRSYG